MSEEDFVSELTVSFDPPGLWIGDLEQLSLTRERGDGFEVLIASRPEMYGSGPSCTISVGWVENEWERVFVTVPWNSNSMPITEFSRWWPLPTVSFSRSD